jgi:hypothetical protein
VKITIHKSPKSPHAQRILSVVAQLHSVQRYFIFTVADDERLNSTGQAADAATLAHPYESRADGQYDILIVDDLLVDNWFSHEYRASSVITLGDWERIYAPPSLKAYLTYQIAQSIISFAADLSEEMAMNLVHEPPQGCIFDLAAHKPSIRYGMVAGNLCPACAIKLRALGVSEDAIAAVEAILQLVRSESLARPVALDPASAFIVMRFTNNDDNDNAWKYGIRPGVEDVGYKAFRADNHIESGQIFEKVFRAIRRSRLVIAKIDEVNLNVYFELGVAMGLFKDVLLISEQSLVLNLPSDLRNWECLTYPKGDYDRLKQSVSAYLRHTYLHE